MTERLTAEELAERSGATVERVDQLVQLGIIPARPEGFNPSDLQRISLAEAFERGGISLSDISEGIARERISFDNFDLYFPDPASLSSLTAEDLAAELGKSGEFVDALVRALGLPRAERGKRLREDDVRMLRGLVRTWPLASEEEILRVARLYADGLRKIAESMVQLFQQTTTFRLIDQNLPFEEVEQRAGEMAVRAIAEGERFVAELHRRHLEHYIVEESVARTEGALERAGVLPERAARPPAIAFLDLTGYTSLTESVGDQAAAELAASVAVLVEETAASYGGRSVKWLGDGVMFHFPAPAAAVESALELVEQAPSVLSVRARVGVNAGPVIFREGDYFGRTVNIAARIADYARPHEVLVSDEVVQAGPPELVEYEPLGEVPLKGISHPVPLYRAERR